MADPIETDEPGTGPVTGDWGVVGNKMIWLHDDGVIFPVDSNLVKEIDSGHFVLSGRNGTKTYYALVERDESDKCPSE